MHDPPVEEVSSDSTSYTCTCPAAKVGGTVLLFYRYWSNTPLLSNRHRSKTDNPQLLAEWHKDLTSRLNLGGKLRIAKEGFNITVGGTKSDIDEYMNNCVNHWSFDGLPLDTEAARLLFFKPSDGCACVFGSNGGASVRVTAEITPMGVEGYSPKDWSGVEDISPEEFHKRCHEDETLLMDVRNHYESRIGYFVLPRTSEPAFRPPIRRFSQWPQFLKWHPEIMRGAQHKQIMTYCTGGIRCEKGVRWMHENLEQDPAIKICTLRGGIAGYMAWMEEEIRQGRKEVRDSLFRGRNYVFDGRGSTGLMAPMEPVATCHVCASPTDRMSECRSKGCHLVLVICLGCDDTDPRCCPSCHDSDGSQLIVTRGKKGSARRMCACEQAREEQLWASNPIIVPKTCAVSGLDKP